MADALHIVCPHCDAINRVPRERLRDGAKCGSCHRRLFEGRPAALNRAARFDKHARRSDIPLLSISGRHSIAWADPIISRRVWPPGRF
jgi:thioredoxin 2